MADPSFIQYMRAHGNTPGPTQRPYLTGAVSSIAALVPYLVISYSSGTVEQTSLAVGVSVAWIAAASVMLMVLAGLLYAAIFRRAANDRRGGWMFGMAYGFLVWTLSPVTLWQLVAREPFLKGRSAIGSFAAHIVFGLVLGLVFPHVHRQVRQPMGETVEKGRTDG